MRKRYEIDWITVLVYGLLVIGGWLNIYAASSTFSHTTIFDLDYSYGRQFFWIIISGIVATMIMYSETRLYEFLAYIVFGLTLTGVLVTILIAKATNGAMAWIEIGSFKFQPAEFAKIGTALALARFMSRYNFTLRYAEDVIKAILALVGIRVGSYALRRPGDIMIAFGIVLLPMTLILLQNDAGSALVFASFLFVFYREGLHPLFLITVFFEIAMVIVALLFENRELTAALSVCSVLAGSLFLLNRMSWKSFISTSNLAILAGGILLTFITIFGVHTTFEFLQPHQQQRIRTFLNPESDPGGAGYNVIQSKIAIGSGGVFGKGFLEGTQTKYDFVPEQHTDFIFCTIGEEHGWIGSTVLLILFFILLYRVLRMAETSKTKFARIYGYGVASILFFHITINIAMTIGLAPVIGIPLPFFSYGGSSLLAFTILLFILVNHHAYRVNILGDAAK